jgi:two-component system chemotaxis response regulator CheB
MKGSQSMKVLLVEDSATVAAYVVSILGSEQDIQLLPVATSAEEGVKSALDNRPDVILMDMKLPDRDGIWAIEEIMVEAPCPIVVLSGHLTSRERNITFESLRAGAVDVLAKPLGMDGQQRAAFRQSLVSTVRLMSEAVVVRRMRARKRPELAPAAATLKTQVSSRELRPIRQVLIGASTGGPELLFRLLGAIKPPFRLPIWITQHTLVGFDDSLAQWLSLTGHDVKCARQGELPRAGCVRIAPAETGVKLAHGGLNLVPARRGAPADTIDTMFDSAAKAWGEQCLGIILTGMGKDGAAGMRALCDRGALTIGQSAATCVVSSMPDAAQARLALRYSLSPEEIAGVLRELSADRNIFPDL